MISHELIRYAARALAKTLLVCNTTAFSRASIATYTDASGIVQTAQPNVLRNAHYVNGVLQPPLIEAAATNPLLFSNDFTNGAWTKVSCTPTPGVADPAGGNSATTLTATAPNGGVRQILAAGSAIVRTSSFWMRRRTGTGTVSIQNPDGSSNVVVALTGAWAVFSATGGASATRNSIVTIATSGDAIDIWMPQLDDGAVATSTIVPATTNAPVTRAADIDQMLGANATSYTRQTGSFVTEGFAVGEEITASSFARSANNGTKVITAVAPLSLDVDGGCATEAAVAGRSLSVGFPSSRAWENTKFKPATGVPYVTEQYLPGPSGQQTLGPNGDLELTPIYLLYLNVPAEKGELAAHRYIDKLLTLFAPRTAIALSNGDVLRVRSDVAPYAGQLLPSSESGFSYVLLTVPLRLRTANSI